jgi:alkaline phosphatase D
LSGKVDRREFISLAGALGASLAWSNGVPAASRASWHERRELYPQGVASGDPDHHSVVLWTRRPFNSGTSKSLIAEIALDPGFRNVVAATRAKVADESDWTCRVLVGGLRPSTEYWYRFSDPDGNGSRIGRTITAPMPDDDRTVRFAFVSCQSVNEGAQNALRRLVWEDRLAPVDARLGFLLHLGDFIYEIVEYPDEVPHRYGRTVFDIGRVPDSRKVDNFHVPTNLSGYRMVYRAHINDPDIQDARAWLPFVCIGDNHEFSWQGWQSFIKYDGKSEPAQKLRVAANQAWWEYIPSRVRKASGPSLDRFDPPTVVDAPIRSLDADGFGNEMNNRIAVGSMTSYRTMRYGRHVDLIMTDFHSYCMEDPASRHEADALTSKDFPLLYPEEALVILDGGQAYGEGQPPNTIEFNGTAVPNFRKDDPPITLMGHVQKAWLKEQLAASKATWKVWAATNGTLDARTDPQNLPAGLGKPWPAKGYATLANGDFSTAFRERAEVYDHVRDTGVTGFVIVSGDRHSFFAGYAAKALPPAAFEPVGIGFITGSISAVGYAEALEYGLKGHPLRALYDVERPNGAHDATINVSLKHGVRSALEYARSGDIERARAVSNAALAPHLEFVDMGGHGYSVVTAGADSIRTEFVCVPRPISHAETPDGGPIRYRVAHAADRWARGEKPKLARQVLEGDPKLSI